jgi:hypothetical protein
VSYRIFLPPTHVLQRKPCQYKVKSTSTICPPSHSWVPPPNLKVSTPGLPELYTMHSAKGIQESQLPPLSPTSKYSLDTINFEVGVLNPGNADQSWMVVPNQKASVWATWDALLPRPNHSPRTLPTDLLSAAPVLPPAGRGN